MFYEIVNNLCKEHNITITRMAEEIGLSNAAPTSWRKGSEPKLATLEKIAEYFGVSIDYLRGQDNKKTPTPAKGERDYLAVMNALNQADDSTWEVIQLLLKLK